VRQAQHIPVTALSIEQKALFGIRVFKDEKDAWRNRNGIRF
jgi:hypothetical protein